MWIKTQEDVLINTDYTASIYVCGAKVLATLASPKMVAKTVTLGTYPSNEGAQIVFGYLLDSMMQGSAIHHMYVNRGKD